MISASLGPCILTVLTKMIAKLRWEETSYIPLQRVCCRRSNFEDNMLTCKLSGRSAVLENNTRCLWKHEGIGREQSRAAPRNGH